MPDGKRLIGTRSLPPTVPDADQRILVPERGLLTPVTVPGSLGAVAVAAGLATDNPVALGLGALLVVGGLAVGGLYALGRAVGDWPRSVASRRDARRTLAANRPDPGELRRAFGWTVGGVALFVLGLVPLRAVGTAANRGSFGLGLPDGLTWILAVVLLGGSVLVSVVGARTAGRGVDRLAVGVAREWVYRRASGRDRPWDASDRERPRRGS